MNKIKYSIVTASMIFLLNGCNYDKNEQITTKTNFSGGIQGGISNGQDIYFRTVFKPTATISKSQQTIDTEKQLINLEAHGRHDPCVVPRAVPIIEAMAAIVTLDAYLLNKTHN